MSSRAASIGERSCVTLFRDDDHSTAYPEGRANFSVGTFAFSSIFSALVRVLISFVFISVKKQKPFQPANFVVLPPSEYSKDWHVFPAIAISSSDAYVGGFFTTADGSPANYIAKWNGSTWSALGTGMDNWVIAIAVSGTDVYAGGYFTTAGGTCNKLRLFESVVKLFATTSCLRFAAAGR